MSARAVSIRMTIAALMLAGCGASAYAQAAPAVEHRVLATLRTSTMEKELNEAAADGFRLRAVMGGETAFGGKEVVVVMSTGERRGRYGYKLLAARRTSTMQKELQEAGDAGYHYRGQSIFETAFGGKEVVVILERDDEAPPQAVEYRLFATLRTSTLERELARAGADGYEVVGLTLGETAVGGDEVVAIARRPKQP